MSLSDAEVRVKFHYIERKLVEHDFQLDTFAQYIDKLMVKINNHTDEIVTLTELKRSVRTLCSDLERGICNIDSRLEKFNNGR